MEAAEDTYEDEDEKKREKREIVKLLEAAHAQSGGLGSTHQMIC